jgi:hypothetical protein
MSTKSQAHAKQETFEATIDLKPISTFTLRVKGKVEYRGGGLTASLARANPQGISDTILILEVYDTKTGDVSTKPIVTQDVSYEEDDARRFKQVTIRSAAPDFTIDVQELN